MNKFYLLAFSLFSATLVAQNKVNINGLLKLESIESKNASRGTTVTENIEAILLMNPGWNEKTFEKYQVEIVTEVSDDILVANIPADKIIALSEEKDVKYVEFGNTYEVTLNYARPACNVDAVQEGFSFNNTTMKYDGTGVVTGLMDTGIDPNHPMFQNQAGEPRVKEAYDYSNNVSATTPEAVIAFTTDNASQSHGTHVAGIMAGKAYNTKGRYCILASPTGGTITQRMGQIPFYGVATGSDIVMAGGVLTETNILKGAKAVAAYAEANNKPFVLNLSLSNNQGPHDGTGSLEQGLAKIGRNGIICIATGNEGTKKIFAGKKFTGSDNTFKTFITDNTFSGIDLWTNNNTPVTVTMSFYSNGTLTTVAKITQPDETVSSAGTTFSQYMTGSFTMRSEVNRLNKRFHVSISGEFSQKKDGQKVALTVTGSDGQEIYCYGHGNAPTQFSSYGIQGYTDGTNNGSASSLAAAPNTIAVGAFNTSNAWGRFDKTVSWYVPQSDYTIGGIAPYSGYGRTFNERGLPTVCAPGTAIKSSLNRYDTATKSTDENNRNCAKIDNSDSMTAYWGPMMGTSMACPFVAGTIALWLQADPTLKYADIVSIIERTSVNPLEDDPDPDTNEMLKWGAGKIDALAGIKEVLSMKSAGLQGVIPDEVIITRAGERAFNISAPAAAGISVKLYNIQGLAVAAAETAGTELNLDASGVAGGVYILQVETALGTPTTRRILLR